MIKITLSGVFLTMFCFNVSSQSDSLQQQINQQVWKPFIEAFNDLNTEGFMRVHSKEMTRVIQDGNILYGYDKYYQENKRGDDGTKKAGRRRAIELRFVQRIAAADKAFEVGYYKTTNFLPNGTTQSGYGKFHVLLRKENGIWKILMDADASEKTDEALFSSGKPIQ